MSNLLKQTTTSTKNTDSKKYNFCNFDGLRINYLLILKDTCNFHLANDYDIIPLLFTKGIGT